MAPELCPQGGESDDCSGERPARVIVLRLSPDIFSTNAPASNSVSHGIVFFSHFLSEILTPPEREIWCGLQLNPSLEFVRDKAISLSVVLFHCSFLNQYVSNLHQKSRCSRNARRECDGLAGLFLVGSS